MVCAVLFIFLLEFFYMKVHVFGLIMLECMEFSRVVWLRVNRPTLTLMRP